MINLLLLLIFNSLICVGLYHCFKFEFKPPKFVGDKTIDNDTKEILWFYKYYFLDKLPHRLSKPFGNCLTCMASVFSFLPFWYSYNWEFMNFDYICTYPFYILALSGVNSIIQQYIGE